MLQPSQPEQPDRPDPMWKLYLILEINQEHIQNNFLENFLERCQIRYISYMFITYFLGHDGCLWNINLTILWNHTMKNFQVRHSQCDNIIFPETFFLEALSNF